MLIGRENTATDLHCVAAYSLDFSELPEPDQEQLEQTTGGGHWGRGRPHEDTVFHVQIIQSLADKYLENHPVADDGSSTLPEQAIHMHVSFSVSCALFLRA
jgi:hypothetical protein